MKNDYELAATLTPKMVDNVINSWDEGCDDIKSFDCLVRLGDSRELAMASILNRKARGVDNSECYNAYCL